MSQETLIIGERKVRRGVDSTFAWVAPEPIYSTGGPPVVAGPALALTKPKGGATTAVTLTVVHAELAVAVAGMANDMRTLTIAATTNVDGIQGQWGQAFLITEDEGWYSVKIVKITATQVVLADQVPRKLALTSGGRIQFATYTGPITAAFAAVAVRDCQWRVTYASRHGNDTPPLLGLRQQGLLHVVEQAFWTGLSHALFMQFVGGLGETAPRTQQGWEPQLAAGGSELVQEIRKQLVTRGLTEDNIPAGELLQLAHVSYALAAVLDLTAGEQADRFRAQARERVDTALRAIWLDVDGDNVVDDGEEQTPLTAPLVGELAPFAFPAKTWTGVR